MSNSDLPDVKRILSMAKSYRRACGAERNAKGAYDWGRAFNEKKDLGERLLDFIDRGEFSKRRLVSR